MLKTAGLTFGSRLLGAILSFGLIVLISRFLGVESRGICGLYLVIIAITTAIADIAGGATAPYLLNYYSAVRLLKGQMIWSLIPAVLVPIPFVFLSGISMNEALMLMMAGWLNSTWSIQQHLLIGLQKFAAFNFMTVAIPACSLAGFTAFYFSGLASPVYYLIALSISWFLASVSSVFFHRKAFMAHSKEKADRDTADIFSKGMQNQLSHLASLLNSRLIFFILPAASLGLWSNSLTLCEAFFLIPGSLGQVAYGLMATNKREVEKKHIFQRVWWVNLLTLFPCLLVAFLLPDSFWQLIFGKGFSGISAWLDMSLPGVGLYSFYLLVSYRQSASGNFRYNLVTLVVGLAANITCTGLLVLAGKYSLYGGILALVFGWGFASLAALMGLKYSHPTTFSSLFKLPKF